ncbi:uncharacterized protein LOC126378154 [Pectinophora gossypiella]|uniref:uncharacterized protein LOC126378154 n=1 Tax=Pectinophora gossypiella TaxID=13191 RepID=UPI00214F4058|nr:uncharacterized protein LOC126378154 [Pectinophora gossypiella]XP_049882301.1 uncharacterized protein LOC126378154 [Pectinophora gossypiella]
MKSMVFLGLLLLGLASTAPTSNDDEHLVITQEFFPDEFKYYEGKNDIVKIVVPLNNLNFEDDSSEYSNNNNSTDTFLFFVEIDDKGDKTLYVRKHDVTSKLLENGRDAVSPPDDSQLAYFAAKDGLYSYNYQSNKAEKYGAVEDDLIGIEMGNISQGIYVLTADKHVYKVTEDGTKKVKIDDIKNPEQIVLDFSNNLFYVDSEKKIYVANEGGVKKIEGLPANPTTVTLIRPPFVVEEGIPVIVDKQSYLIYPNGTSEYTDIDINVDITAYSMEAALVQYYAYDKKIYEYNVLTILLGDLLEELKKYLDDKKNEIQSIATRSRSEFLNKV